MYWKFFSMAPDNENIIKYNKNIIKYHKHISNKGSKCYKIIIWSTVMKIISPTSSVSNSVNISELSVIVSIYR